MSSLIDWFDRLFNKHKLVRRGLMIWAIWIITWVIQRVFADLTLITPSVATALATVVGILATVIAMYQWSRNKDTGE